MKNTALYFLFALLLVGAAFAYVNKVTPQRFVEDLFSKPYAYKVSQQGVLFASNEASPPELLTGYASVDSFILSPQMVSQSGTLNSFVSQALVQQQIVLAGHRKVTTTVIRVYDAPNGKWIGCQTDYGTARQNEFVSVDACQSLLTSPRSVTITIAFPDSARSSPLIELSSPAITIFPVNETEIPGVNFLLLRSIYPDASTLIGGANSILNSLQNPKDSNQTTKPLDSNILK